MTEVLDRLRVAKEKADKDGAVRENYLAYVEDRKSNGGWTTEDVSEYRGEVKRIMADGTEDEKEAAISFWALKASENKCPEVGADARIRKQIKEGK